MSTITRALRSPRRALQAVIELTHGHLVRVSCALRGVRLKAGRNFRVGGRLIIKGPGLVIIGDNVRFDDTVTPWTYDHNAKISIGDNSFVNGASFGAAHEIAIGANCILGRSHLMDTDFHSTQADRHSGSATVRIKAVRLEENVWIAANVGILPGTVIGRNSVVGFGAVCSGVYPPDVIIAGNPARVIRPIQGAGSAEPEDIVG